MSKISIGFDASTTLLTKGGTTIYFNQLLAALKYIEPQNNYILFSSGNTFLRTKIGFKQIDTLYRELYWQQIKLPALAKAKRVDILHCPAHLAPLRAEVPRVFTIHDIYILQNPRSFRMWGANFSKFIYPKIINSGCKIITDTHFTKKEIISRFNIDAEQISAIHLGIDKRFKLISNKEELELVKNKYNLPSEFILYVGAIEPRKNIVRLIDALGIVHQSEKIPIVLVSYGGYKNSQILKYINKLSKNVVLLRNINEFELSAIYNLAKLFVSPSLYEGFGLPILEAMACGCPSAISNCEAHKEIGNDSALFFDPLNVDDISEKILTIINSTELTKSLITKGLSNSQKYNWTKCAKETLKVYKSLI